jgi:hypothetical protein
MWSLTEGLVVLVVLVAGAVSVVVVGAVSVVVSYGAARATETRAAMEMMLNCMLKLGSWIAGIGNVRWMESWIMKKMM